MVVLADHRGDGSALVPDQEIVIREDLLKEMISGRPTNTLTEN
jgi:hypothetical protein